MSLPANRRRYIREGLENELGRIGVPVRLYPDYISACFAGLKNGSLSAPNVHNLEEQIVRIAQEAGQSPECVKERIVDEPAILFGLEPLVHRDFSAQKKIIPSDQEIADAALHIWRSTGRYPTGACKHDGLPDGSMGWSMLLKTLLPEKGKTVKSLVMAFHADALKHPEENANLRKTMPDEATIAAAAFRIKLATGYLPNNRSKYEELPEGSLGWTRIQQKLRERGTSIKKLVTLHCHSPRVSTHAHFAEAAEEKSGTVEEPRSVAPLWKGRHAPLILSHAGNVVSPVFSANAQYGRGEDRDYSRVIVKAAPPSPAITEVLINRHCR